MANCGLCAHNADGAELSRSARPQTGQSPWPPCPRPPGRLQRLSPSDTNWRTRPATQAPRAGKMPGRKVLFLALKAQTFGHGGRLRCARTTMGCARRPQGRCALNAGLASPKIGASGWAQRGSIASRARTSLMSCPPSRTRGHAQYSATYRNVADFFGVRILRG